MNTRALVAVVVICLSSFAVAASPVQAAKTKDCGTHHYRSGDSFTVFARGVTCTFAVKHTPASYNRHTCPRGWRYWTAHQVRPRCERGSAYFFGSPTDDL